MRAHLSAPGPKRFEIAIAADADQAKLVKAALGFLGAVIAKYEAKTGAGRFLLTTCDPTVADPAVFTRCIAIVDTSIAATDPRIVAKLYRVLYVRALALGVTLDSPPPPTALPDDDTSDEPALPSIPQ